MSIRRLIVEYKVEIFALFCLLLTLSSLTFFVAEYVKEKAVAAAPEATGAFTVDEVTAGYLRTNPSFPELSDYLTSLAERKGGVYALNVLINAVLPPNIDAHLMGHNVTKKLYEQEGVDALKHCTSDLGYACAHAIVIASLFERGMVVFDEINEICGRAEGPGAYHMCFHGFGHGVLAFADYELPEAIKLCGKVGTQEDNFYEAVECVGGAVMEMRGGIHDAELWEKNGKKYLSDERPLDLCLQDFMLEEYRFICLVYATPFIFDSQGAQDIPTFEEYGPAIRACNVLTDPKYREACYGGFAKEFVGFVFGRDIRMIRNITDEQLAEVDAACQLAEVEDGIAACIKHTLYKLFGSGLYGFDLSGRFCGIVPNQFTDYCERTLIEIVMEQGDLTREEKDSFCEYTKEKFGRECTDENKPYDE
jgi:hypothetical protein